MSRLSVYSISSYPLMYIMYRILDKILRILSTYRFNNYLLIEGAYTVMLHIASLSLRDLLIDIL